MIFSRFFTSGKLSQAVDLSGLKTDFHSHLLPGIDDGVSDMEMAVELVKAFQSFGYEKLITTPHIMADIYKNTPEIIQNRLEELKKTLYVQGVDMKLECAAEYLLDDAFLSKVQNDELMTFGNKHVLVEFPHFSAPPNLFEITFELQVKGYKIVLAHPERYMFWHHSMQKYEEMKNRGIFFQLNITSLAGQYSPEVKKMAEKLIDMDMIDYACSDMHNYFYLSQFEKARFSPHLKKLLDSGMLKNGLL